MRQNATSKKIDDKAEAARLRAVQLIQVDKVKLAEVGSRVTCNPAPTDTDQDILVLVPSHTFTELQGLRDEQFNAELYRLISLVDGAKADAMTARSRASDVGNTKTAETSPFVSFRDGELNYIVTKSAEFYRRFWAATTVAKRLNLLDKADRVALFQAVLYGNDTPIKVEIAAALDQAA